MRVGSTYRKPHRSLLTSGIQALVVTLLAFALSYCSGQGHGNSSQTSGAHLIALDIPVSLVYVPPTQSLNLESGGFSFSGQGFGLVDSGTSLNFSVSGCSSGYTLSTQLIGSGVINLYNADQNCLVKLQSFVLGSTIYSATATGATNFSSWLAGQVATFANTTLSTDLIKVFITQQVTQAGVLSSDQVIYNFTDISAGSTDNVPQTTVSFATPLSVTGEAAPNFTILQARYLSTNANGSGNMSFTLQCGNSVTGSAGAYSCTGTDSIAVPLTQFDYIFIHDAYSQGTITVAQANAAFAANTPTSVASGLEVGVGGSDLNSNVIPHGGFYTSNASPLVTGTVAIFPNNLNNVFILRRKDASGNVYSFLYFYVDLAAITQL